MPTKFKDLHIVHWDGYNPPRILSEVLDFINDPTNADHEYVNSHISYFHPTIKRTLSDDPESDLWVEVTLLYKTDLD
jgi:hypothetical protein